jgi:hypothetical protein
MIKDKRNRCNRNDGLRINGSQFGMEPGYAPVEQQLPYGEIASPSYRLKKENKQSIKYDAPDGNI